MRRPFFRPAGVVPAVLALLVLSACSKGGVIGSGPLPTPQPVVPHVTAEFTVPTPNSAPNGITIGLRGVSVSVANKGVRAVEQQR